MGTATISSATGMSLRMSLGNLMRPDYLTGYFPQYIQKHGLRRMRFHDLRHSCASLLLANGVPLKQIQDWLEHSDFSATANIFAHLDYSSKLSSAQAQVGDSSRKMWGIKRKAVLSKTMERTAENRMIFAANIKR